MLTSFFCFFCTEYESFQKTAFYFNKYESFQILNQIVLQITSENLKYNVMQTFPVLRLPKSHFKI